MMFEGQPPIEELFDSLEEKYREGIEMCKQFTSLLAKDDSNINMAQSLDFLFSFKPLFATSRILILPLKYSQNEMVKNRAIKLEEIAEEVHKAMEELILLGISLTNDEVEDSIKDLLN
jgi:hypothetical protein